MLKNKPRTIELVEKMKLSAGDLRPGMYVCELDRPWLETPFLLQGFELKNDADIQAVRQHCEWVYIDLLRTTTVDVTVGDVGAVGYVNQKQGTFGKKDLVAAGTTQKQTSDLMKTFVDEIRFGQSPDVQLAKAAVSGCVASVMSNPDAMMFLARLRSKGADTSQHAFNVCVFSLVIGRLLGLDSHQLENLGTCGLLHDMGKVAIPDHILNKPDVLTPQETAIMQTHTREGRDILMSGRNLYSGTVDVAYGHHEHLDGTGYPRGLEGTQLNTNCKIVAVVDKYDAITSQKPYRPAKDHLSAVAILNKLALANKIDPKLTTGFVSYLGIYPPGSIVELNSGEVGIVIDSLPEQRLRPQLLIVRDPAKQPTQRFVDLAEKKTDERGKPYRIVSVRRPGDYGIDLSQYCDLIMQAFE
jgi:HD-GYP domain-containing protein (c-di-GMP phosphodiesterase class II)